MRVGYVLYRVIIIMIIFLWMHVHHFHCVMCGYYYIQWLVRTCVVGTCVVGTVGLVCYVVFFVMRLCKFYQNHTIKNHKINVHSIYCVLIGWPAEVCAAYTWSYYTRDRSASKRSVCLVERYNSLSLERAREKYTADIYGLLVSIFSVNHLY